MKEDKEPVSDLFLFDLWRATNCLCNVGRIELPDYHSKYSSSRKQIKFMIG